MGGGVGKAFKGREEGEGGGGTGAKNPFHPLVQCSSTYTGVKPWEEAVDICITGLSHQQVISPTFAPYREHSKPLFDKYKGTVGAMRSGPGCIHVPCVTGQNESLPLLYHLCSPKLTKFSLTSLQTHHCSC